MTAVFIPLFPAYLLYLLGNQLSAWVAENGWTFHDYGGWGFTFLWMLEVLCVQIVVSLLALSALKLRKSPSFKTAKLTVLYAFLASLLIIGTEVALPILS